MRIILMLISLAVVGYLALQGFPDGSGHVDSDDSSQPRLDPRQKATDANQAILDAAQNQRQALQQQLQQ